MNKNFIQGLSPLSSMTNTLLAQRTINYTSLLDDNIIVILL